MPVVRQAAELPAIAGGTPVRTSMLPYSYHWIGRDEVREVLDTLHSGWLTSGPKTVEFERKFAEFVGARRAVAVNTGSAALHAAVLAAGIGPGDEVITTPLTFVSTVNAIIHAGATPVFADIDPQTMNIDPVEVKRRINRATRAILPVHYCGQPCDMKALQQLAGQYKLLLIEDGTHAPGATAGGKSVGAIGDMTCFSFHPSKNMTTAEGGMVTTDSDELADKMRAYRFHGFVEDYLSRSGKAGFKYPQLEFPGFKYVMTDLQAGIGLHQLGKLNKFNARRAALAKKYNKAFADCGNVLCPAVKGDVTSAWHLYIIRLRLEQLTCSRDKFIDALQQENISASVHYLPVHRHPYYAQRFGYSQGDFPKAEDAYSRMISLPMFPRMKNSDLGDVVTAVKRLETYFRK